MDEWKKCLKVMFDRVQSVRSSIKENLDRLGTPGNWDHITTQRGMFSFLGLTPHQVEYIRIKHHVHILPNGRANMCGLNSENISGFAGAIHDTVTKVHN